MAGTPSRTYLAALSKTGERLEAIHFDPATTEQDAFEALADWLKWAMVLDDQLGKIDGDDYRGGRAADLVGVALPGLRHAWNLFKHQGQDLHYLVELTPGFSFPMGFPLIFREITWLPFDQLPVVPEGRRRENQERAYQDYLQGKPVRVLAPSITRFLADAATQGEDRS
jgi:hypothetical protein